MKFPIENNKKFAKKIVAGLKEKIETGDLTYSFKIQDCPEIMSIYSGFVEYEQPKWQLAQVYDVPNIDIDHLLFIVDRKKLKLESYQLCDEQWLLIIIEFWDPAQDQAIILEGE